MPAAVVEFVRHDYFKIRHDHFIAGIKALLDAFKERASGRTDGNSLHYFGAIVDDGPSHIDLKLNQVSVDHPSKAFTEIKIHPK